MFTKSFDERKKELEMKIMAEKQKAEVTRQQEEKRKELLNMQNELKKLKEYNAQESTLGKIRAYTRPAIKGFEAKFLPALKDGFERVGKASMNLSAPNKKKKDAWGF